MQRPTTLVPALSLMAITMVWGSTFFLTKGLVERIPTLDYLGIRFAVASAVIVIWRFRALFNIRWRTWKRGVAAGGAFAAAQFFQTLGLEYSEASVTGFVTAMYIVITPLLMLLIYRIALSPRIWGSVVLAFVGLIVFSLQGFSIGFGELITLTGAFFYAVHIVLLGRWSHEENELDLASIQILTLGVVLSIAAIPGGIVLPRGPWEWTVLVYLAVVAGILAILVQTWAQAHLHPTSAALIMSTEPVFAASFAVLFGGEQVTWRLLVGGTLILSAMVINVVQTNAEEPEEDVRKNSSHTNRKTPVKTARVREAELTASSYSSAARN